VCATVLVPVGPARPADAAPIISDARAAVGYAAAHGMSSGIAVLDTRTGRLFTAGRAGRRYASASVVKTLIATRLLLTGRMTGRVATLARRMITRSDNAAAWRLYPRVGGDRLLPWIAAHYHLAGLGAPPTMPGVWGSTQITARGLVRFYAAVRGDRVVWPWLGRAMHHYAAYSTAGEPNAWGIAVAAPSAAVKNGWDTDRDVRHPANAIIDTTGLVQHDRFAVAILAEGPHPLYYARGEAIVTREAQRLMPGGHLVPPPTVTSADPGSGATSGATRVTVTGTGFTRVTQVSFGGVPAERYRVLSRTTLVAVSPRHTAGTVHIRVRTTHGVSAAIDDDRLRHDAPAVPPAGVPAGTRRSAAAY
jgi:hypothetical protein